MHFNLHDFLSFSISGRGRLHDYLVFQYDSFKKGESINEDVELKIFCVPDLPRSVRVVKSFKDGQRKFCLTECNSFLFFVGSDFCFFDGDASVKDLTGIYLSTQFPMMLASKLIDFIFRAKLSRMGIALVHAAALSKNGNGLLIPAWKGMGKTALTLKLLKSGYEYLADDRVWICSSGCIYSYPRYVVLKDSNYFYFPEFMNIKIKMKYRLTKAIDHLKWRFKGFNLLKKIWYRFFKVKPKHFHVENLIPNAVVANKTNLNFVFFLYRKKTEISSVQIQDISSVVSAIDSINNYEWDSDLLRLCSARDALFNSGVSWKKEFLQLLDNDKAFLDKALCKSMCLEAVMPINPLENDLDDVVALMDEICK